MVVDIQPRLMAVAMAVLVAVALPARAELQWENDLEKAKQVAAEQHKDLFINFTGTSWCQSCMELEREILSTDDAAAKRHGDFAFVGRVSEIRR